MRRLLLLLVPFLAAAGVYAQSLAGDYVYDDARFVAHNPAVREGVPLSRYFTDPATQTADRSFQGLYRPLRTVSFRAVEVLWSGPSAQRAANLLLHLGNGLLVLALLRALVPAGGTARTLGLAVFLLHPAAVESTAFISSRGDLLAVTFCLVAFVLYVRPSAWAGAASAAAFGLALLSKESAVFLPVGLALCDALCGGLRRRAVRLAFLFAVLGLFLYGRHRFLGTEAFGQGVGLGLGGRDLFSAVLASVSYYTGVLLCPWWLSFEIRLVWGAGTVACGFLLLAGVVAGGVLLRRRSPAAARGLLLIPAALLPVTAAQFLFPLKIAVANRFAYPALIGLAIVATALAGRGRRYAALLVVAALCFVPLTAKAAAAWRDSSRLWAAVLERDADNPVALFGLGTSALERGDAWTARTLLARAAVGNPGYPKLAIVLGHAALVLAERAPLDSPEQRRFLVEAQSGFHEAVRLWEAGVAEDRELYRPALVDASWLALRIGRPDVAASHIEKYLAEPGPPLRGAAVAARFHMLSGAFEKLGDPALSRKLGTAAMVAEEGLR